MSGPRQEVYLDLARVGLLYQACVENCGRGFFGPVLLLFATALCLLFIHRLHYCCAETGDYCCGVWKERGLRFGRFGKGMNIMAVGSCRDVVLSEM